MKIGINRDGALFSTRMGWVRTSQKTLAAELRGGCYNDADPSPVTSVTLEISSTAPKERVRRVLKILEEAGWPKDRVKLETWRNEPREPH